MPNTHRVTPAIDTAIRSTRPWAPSEWFNPCPVVRPLSNGSSANANAPSCLLTPGAPRAAAGKAANEGQQIENERQHHAGQGRVDLRQRQQQADADTGHGRQQVTAQQRSQAARGHGQAIAEREPGGVALHGEDPEEFAGCNSNDFNSHKQRLPVALSRGRIAENIQPHYNANNSYYQLRYAGAGVSRCPAPSLPRSKVSTTPITTG